MCIVSGGVCIVSVCVLVKIYLGRGTYVCEILDTWRWFGRGGDRGFIPIIWVLVRVSRGGGELSDAPSCFSYFDRGHVNMETLVQYFHNKL